MTVGRDWTWETRHGSAAELHDPTPPPTAGRTVREMFVEAPAMVLGSSQADRDVDTAAARRAGISVVRRRSGGGAVLLIPGAHVWLDVWLPAGDPLWLDDVGRSGEWLGDAWIDALASSGFGTLECHRGRLRSNRWSAHVCFAGLGPGEVTSEGRKLVGVSQRRTRDWARFQCLVHRRWDATTTFGLLAAADAWSGGVEWRGRVAEIGDAAVGPALAVALSRTG